MPTIMSDTTVRAFAHCPNPYCPGHAQQEVDAVRVETGQTFEENGGDIPGIERSSVDLRFADSKQAGCPECKRPRELSAEPRPQYQNLSGFDPNGLLSAPPFDPSVKHTEADARVAELEAKLARLEAKVGD